MAAVAATQATASLVRRRTAARRQRFLRVVPRLALAARGGCGYAPLRFASASLAAMARMFNIPS
jgi:hypothetical protein